MKTLSLALMFLLGFANLAAADQIYLVKVTAQDAPKKLCNLGIETDKDNNIVAILYRETDGEVRNFPLKDLKGSKTLVKKAIYSVVAISAKSADPKKVVVTFKYLYDIGNYISPEKHTKQMVLQFNPKTNAYEAFDADANRVITAAYATNHYVDGDLKGIDEIKTW